MKLERALLLICACMIFAIGLVMIFSTTSAEVLDQDLERSTHQALMRQMYYAVGGLILSAVVWRVGCRNLIRFSPVLIVFFTFLLLLTLIPGIGKVVNGSRRWIGIAGFSFQPSEFVKYIVPAYFIHRMRPTFTFREFIKLVGLVMVPVLLILVEPNNGTAAVVVMALTVACFLTKVPLKFWALPLGVFIIVGGTFASQLPYVSARIKVYLHPELDIKGKGHQPYQAKIAAGSGQLLGKGPGNSWQKLSYLPEAQNDYIAAIYAEEFGFLGILFLISLYMFLAYLGFSIAAQNSDPAVSAFIGVVTFLITFQAFLNLGVVSGLLPSTGLNLPLFSQGGTSLIANMMGITLILNASQNLTTEITEKFQHKEWK